MSVLGAILHWVSLLLSLTHTHTTAVRLPTLSPMYAPTVSADMRYSIVDDAIAVPQASADTTDWDSISPFLLQHWSDDLPNVPAVSAI